MAKLIPVLPLAQLQPNQPLCLEHRGVPYCVVQTARGGVKAFVAVCSHKDLAMFPPDVKRQTLVCPFHEAAFDAATGKLAKKSRKKAKPLPEVATVAQDGVLYLEARKEHEKLLPKSERKWVAREAKQIKKERDKA